MKRRVSWDYFMQRRNISYSSLLGMDYDRYTSWCHSRYVIPLDKEEYEAKLAPFLPKKEKQIQEEAKEAFPVSAPSAKSLNKKKKSELLALCESHKIDLKGNETKKQLVSLILDMNNV